MIQPCSTPPPRCFDPANPFRNLSSEAGDTDRFVGRHSFHDGDPPIGPRWTSNWCHGVCISAISQEDADLCAARRSAECIGDGGGGPTIGGDDDHGGGGGNWGVTYQNEEQNCAFTCPDGSEFTYTVPAGQFQALSLVAANDQAHSYACNKATELRICIGAFNAENKPEGMCVGEDYLKTVSLSSPTDQDYSAEIHDGVLPPGLAMSVTGAELTISGTPTSAGQYDVTIRVRAPGAVGYTDKAVSFIVLEIMPDTLSNGTEGTAYSETLTVDGPTTGDVTWDYGNGSLPPGLTLNEVTGVISGTPTTEGTFVFTVTMTDEL